MALTTAQFSQTALNISLSMQKTIQNGASNETINACLFDLCGAIAALAECINANASTLSATGGSTQSIGGQYSATQSVTAPIVTTAK